MFYTYRQNNSGGDFHIKPTIGICKYVIIEANSADDANERAEAIGLYFNGCRDGSDCRCCGDRWYMANKLSATEQPEIYEELVEKKGTDIAVHYLDGTFKLFGQ